MGKTVVEKLLGRKCGSDVRAGDIILCPIDFLMATDTTAPIALKQFNEMDYIKVFDSKKIALVIDHAVPCPNQKVANLHSLMRSFAKEHNIRIFEAGEGICHQLMIEYGLVQKGDIVLGADSHTCTYGALGAFATGVGTTDFLAAMVSGKSWFKVPETTLIYLHGEFQQGVYAKDLMLYLIGLFGSDGQTYRSIEFLGDAIEKMNLSEKLTMCNMVIEMGAKNGFICDNTTGMFSDEDACFVEQHAIDVSKLEPQIALPHAVENVVSINEAKGIPIDQCFLGGCTNGKFEDLAIAADIVSGKSISPGMRFW